MINIYGNDRSDILRSTINTENQNENGLRNKTKHMKNWGMFLLP